jgi:carbonic anhydrase/acetyltransferase-like protein (isoleucine patch superfamily)
MFNIQRTANLVGKSMVKKGEWIPGTLVVSGQVLKMPRSVEKEERG